MNTLEIEVSRPHYIHRNEQFDRKEQEKPVRIKTERKSIPVKNISAPGRPHSFQDEELAKIKQLKEWLMQLLKEAKNSWEEELISKKNMILLMKKGHRERLMRILQYIESLRKKAYEQYRHVCDKNREECCTVCFQRGIFFNESVKNYLKEKEERSLHENGQQISNNADHKEEVKPARKPSERHSAMNLTTKQKRQSRYSHLSEKSGESNDSQEYMQSEAQRVKNAPLSKFRKGERERTSHKVSPDRNSEVDIKLIFSQQRENGQEYRFSQLKKDEQEQKPQSRVRKSGIPANIQDLSTSKIESQSYSKAEDSNNKRNSRGSFRQSVLKQTSRGSYQQSEFPKGQFKLIDAEQATTTLKKQSAISAGKLISKFSLPRSSQNNDNIIQRSHKKKKTVNRRNNKYIKKNQTDLVEIMMTSSSDSDDEAGRKRQRDEIESLMREKEYLRNENYKKISRYRRERMFYDVIKQEILHGQGMEDIMETEIQEHKDLLNSQYSSHDYQSVQEIDQTTKPNFPKPRLKKYSLMERKESLISKLAMLNDGNTFQSIKGKFQEILNQSGNMIKEDTFDKNTKNPVQKFLSEVLKITDLKRLMKDKFFKEADWSPKMREMHQFYTYLEYSMEAFRSKLKKTAELGWKELSYEGKIADSKLDGLILDNQMRDWEGLELSNIGQEHHREIECSMKYYGIDVKRLKNLNHLNCQLSCSQSMNPIFSSVGQRSMRNIQEISQPIFAFP